MKMSSVKADIKRKKFEQTESITLTKSSIPHLLITLRVQWSHYHQYYTDSYSRLFDKIKLEFSEDTFINNEDVISSPISRVKSGLECLKDIPTRVSYKRIHMEREEGENLRWYCPLEKSIEMMNSRWCKAANDLTSIKLSIDRRVKEQERLRAARASCAATTIFCWWRRRQLENYFKQMKVESLHHRFINHKATVDTLRKDYCVLENTVAVDAEHNQGNLELGAHLILDNTTFIASTTPILGRSVVIGRYLRDVARRNLTTSTTA